MAITSVSGSTPQDDSKQINIKPKEKNPQDIKIFGDNSKNTVAELYDNFINNKKTLDELKQLNKDNENAKIQQETLDELKQLNKENKKQEITESFKKFGLAD